MEEQPDKEGKIRPDSWWYRVYLLVIVWTIVTIAGLWFFSHYFSLVPAN